MGEDHLVPWSMAFSIREGSKQKALSAMHLLVWIPVGWEDAPCWGLSQEVQKLAASVGLKVRQAEQVQIDKGGTPKTFYTWPVLV